MLYQISNIRLFVLAEGYQVSSSVISLAIVIRIYKTCKLLYDIDSVYQKRWLNAIHLSTVFDLVSEVQILILLLHHLHYQIFLEIHYQLFFLLLQPHSHLLLIFIKFSLSNWPTKITYRENYNLRLLNFYNLHGILNGTESPGQRKLSILLQIRTSSIQPTSNDLIKIKYFFHGFFHQLRKKFIHTLLV